MRTWVRTGGEQPCGCCGLTIYRDQPRLLLSGTSWTKVRCMECAGEPVPAVPIDDHQERRRRVQELTDHASKHFTGVAQIALGLEEFGS